MSIEDEIVLYMLEAALQRVQGESLVNSLYMGIESSLIIYIVKAEPVSLPESTLGFMGTRHLVNMIQLVRRNTVRIATDQPYRQKKMYE